MTYETITFGLTDRVATLAIDRPTRMNALTPRVFAELTAAIDAALEQGARAIVLTGTGGAFCSGADLVGDGGAPMPRDTATSLHSIPATTRSFSPLVIVKKTTRASVSATKSRPRIVSPPGQAPPASTAFCAS